MEIEERLNRKVSVGAMRTALKRLEKKGLIESDPFFISSRCNHAGIKACAIYLTSKPFQANLN